MAGTLVATSDNPAETSTVSSMVPMVIGNLSQRELSSPKTAAVPNNRLRISRVVIDCRPQCQRCASCGAGKLLVAELRQEFNGLALSLDDLSETAEKRQMSFAASLAKYVTMKSAPARRMLTRDSRMARSRSSHPFSKAA